MLPSVLVYVDLRLVVEAGDQAVRAITFDAARASRCADAPFDLGPDGPDALRGCRHAAVRATPTQMRRIIATWIKAAEAAAVDALRSAG